VTLIHGCGTCRKGWPQGKRIIAPSFYPDAKKRNRKAARVWHRAASSHGFGRPDQSEVPGVAVPDDPPGVVDSAGGVVVLSVLSVLSEGAVEAGGADGVEGAVDGAGVDGAGVDGGVDDAGGVVV